MASASRSIARQVLLLGAGLCFAAASSAQPVQVLRELPYAPESGASDAVKQECELDSKIPEALAAVIPDVKLVDKFGGGRKLELLIRDVHAPPAGAFSGPKWMTLHGTLKSGSKEIGSFRAKRTTVFGKGTCGMLFKCMNAIADDIAEWLKNPTEDARLGNAS